MSIVPIHDTPILGMATRPKVDKAVEYGNAASFWVEYPSGLVDVSRSRHVDNDATHGPIAPPAVLPSQLDIPVDRERMIRIDKTSSAIVIIDMQKYSRQAHFQFSYPNDYR
ncbi:hypothetical protein SERLA73DRAFT_114689 [Serpula lacrymans var. lacrymans S7.3]|uniref:Isochorismatase-like domain-containing protein n=2 Tax=Serpula lacrymans var. lacrymans TaxID=341189 RepID=F8QB69_SERL3|nr:uncharacterized protein SERLADRAFT_363772 [Serpula lacrymans var. lacrymans S7.9]EGN94455.1 hypothetical protein SERLA73DRAFT_114689 [Serpula lacrymans var. lacrymans S7.3]EGO19939.1 hypothetical protein SERLADRAFT_363772 [Serpula lacrymans var. lacrymans S7.9]